MPELFPASCSVSLYHINTGEYSIDGELIHYLTAGEINKSNEYLQPAAAESFIRRRGLLRKILSLYTGTSPRDIAISVASCGKPFLAEKPELKFSASSSGNSFLCALSTTIELGADIEIINIDQSVSVIPGQLFSREEITFLNNSSAGLYTTNFLALWTRREAFLKLTGKGWLGNSQEINLLTNDIFSASFRPITDKAVKDSGVECSILSCIKNGAIYSLAVKPNNNTCPEVKIKEYFTV